jgi:hypothetical protein
MDTPKGVKGESILTLPEDTEHAFLWRVLRPGRTRDALSMFRLLPGLHSVFQLFDGLCDG